MTGDHGFPLWRTSLERIRQRFSEAASKHGRLSCVLIQSTIPKRPRQGKPPHRFPGSRAVAYGDGLSCELRLLFGPDGAPKVAEKPVLDVNGKPMLLPDGKPAAFALGISRSYTIYSDGELAKPYTDIAGDAGRCLDGLPLEVKRVLWRDWLDGFRRPTNDRDFWTNAVFELAWQHFPGSPLVADKFTWVGRVSVRLDSLEEFRQTAASNDEFAKAVAEIPDPPAHWYSEIGDLLHASVSAVDILLSLGETTAAETSESQRKQPTPTDGQPSTAPDKHLQALLMAGRELERYDRRDPSETARNVEDIPPGHPLHMAVDALQRFYDGALPRPAIKYWRKLLRLARADDEEAPNWADELLAWVRQEIPQIGRQSGESETEESDGTLAGTTGTELNRSKTSETETFRYVRQGDGYFIAGFDESGHVRELKGFNQIFRLIQSPKVPVPMFELVGASKDKRIAADKRSQQPVLDDEAKRQMYERLEEARGDLEGAKDERNTVEVAHCEEEIEKLTEQLSGALGLGGKSRDLNDPTPGLRSKIHGTLATAYKKLRGATPPMCELANHFEASISAEGSCFIYRPAIEPPPQWSQSEKSQAESD